MPPFALAMLRASCRAAQLVDQSQAFLASMPEKTRPRAAASRTAALELARLADLTREVGIDLVELARDRGALRRWSAAGTTSTCRHWCRPTSARTLTPSEAKSPVATGQMPKTPIDAVMVAGCGHDDVGAHRRDVAARSRDVAHRHDHGLPSRAGAPDRVGDGVGRGIGASPANRCAARSPDVLGRAA
jgi:hypothetical protein